MQIHQRVVTLATLSANGVSEKYWQESAPELRLEVSKTFHCSAKALRASDIKPPFTYNTQNHSNCRRKGPTPQKRVLQRRNHTKGRRQSTCGQPAVHDLHSCGGHSSSSSKLLATTRTRVRVYEIRERQVKDQQRKQPLRGRKIQTQDAVAYCNQFITKNTRESLRFSRPRFPSSTSTQAIHQSFPQVGIWQNGFSLTTSTARLRVTSYKL